MDRFIHTNRAADLIHAIHTRHLMCMVDSVEPDAVYLYVGDDEGDHTTRIGFYRVTQDGRVWVNQDDTGLEERWVVIE